jgi:F420H(2)-dependent quinone reductase
MASWNDTVIETFRANDGVVGGHWEGKMLILLHSVGRRSGKEYVSPLVAAPTATAM